MSLVLLLLTSPVEAKSACKALKPKQAADDVTMALVNGAIDSAKLYLSGGTATTSTAQTTQLREDDLAKAWFVYQICTLKEAELLSAAKAEELVELVLVGGATQPAEAAPAAAPTQGAPAGRAGAGGARGARPATERSAGARPVELPARGKVQTGGAGDPNARRSFLMANRASLPNIDAWLGELSAVQACGSGTTTLTVTGGGSVTASGGNASCVQGIAQGMTWPAAGSYTVVVP